MPHYNALFSGKVKEILKKSDRDDYKKMFRYNDYNVTTITLTLVFRNRVDNEANHTTRITTHAG